MTKESETERLGDGKRLLLLKDGVTTSTGRDPDLLVVENTKEPSTLF